jgi:hypothetical protein
MSLADDIRKITEKVTKKWTKQRKSEERGNSSRSSRQYIYSDQVHLSDVAAKLLPPAYAHASGGGKYSVSKRQLYYACRVAFQEATGKELEYNYFSKTLLVQYVNRHPAATASWKLTADPRGTLEIPNTGHQDRIPVGTLQIDDHLRREAAPVANDYIKPLKTQWPSVAAGTRYQGVLYIEKEGFAPILEEAKIADRFDLAVMSCKGQSVVAARRFVDEVCAVGRGVPLFVVTDFDKYGFEIAQRLTTVSDWARENDLVKYRFKNKINVVHLGLRLADVEKYELQEEYHEFSGDFARDSIATEEEMEYLRSNRRVELNAFTSPQFIEWLESKLTEHLPNRLIPDDDTLADAYRRALLIARANRLIEKLEEKHNEELENGREVKVPRSLRRRLKKAMKENPRAWDEALYDLVRSRLP